VDVASVGDGDVERCHSSCERCSICHMSGRLLLFNSTKSGRTAQTESLQR
jgi:hypothetical protein